MDTEGRIRKILAENTKGPVSISNEESLFKSGLLDSFALADLVGGLEEEFAITVPDLDLIPQRFDSIAKIEQYIASRLAG